MFFKSVADLCFTGTFAVLGKPSTNIDHSAPVMSSKRESRDRETDRQMDGQTVHVIISNIGVKICAGGRQCFPFQPLFKILNGISVMHDKQPVYFASKHHGWSINMI